MRLRILAALLLLPALAGCSDASAEADGRSAEERAEAAWRADVEEALGTDVVDLDAIARQAAIDCQRTETSAWLPTLALSGDLATSATEVTRLGLEHACPSVADAYEAALAAVEAADDPLDLVCGPDAELDGEDALKAELVCAAR
jgi:hypothetical protein